MIKDLNVRPETTKFLEENIESKILYVGLGYDILDLIPKAKASKAKVYKWNYNKLKSFCTAKGNHQQNEKVTYVMGERICKSHI